MPRTETTIQNDIKTIRDPLEWYARKHPTTQLAKECVEAVAALKRLEKNSMPMKPETVDCWCMGCDPVAGEIGLECKKSKTTLERENAKLRKALEALLPYEHHLALDGCPICGCDYAKIKKHIEEALQ